MCELVISLLFDLLVLLVEGCVCEYLIDFGVVGLLQSLYASQVISLHLSLYRLEVVTHLFLLAIDRCEVLLLHLTDRGCNFGLG